MWYTPFRTFLRYCEDSNNLLDLTYSGARLVASEPDLLKAIYDPSLPNSGDLNSDRMERSEKSAEVAKSEMERDFPLLHAHTLMGIWGALEALVEDVAIAWIRQNPESVNGEPFSKIKIPFIEFQEMNELARCHFLLVELRRNLKVDLGVGVAKFEKVLDSLGLGGRVDPAVRTKIHETQQIRNVLAHRGGIADQRLADACPNLNYEVGEKIQIDRYAYRKMSFSMQLYAVIIRNRCCLADGQKPAFFKQSIFPGALDEFASATGDNA